MSTEHKRPLAAFLLVAMCCAFVVGQSVRDAGLRHLVPGLPYAVLSPITPDLLRTLDDLSAQRPGTDTPALGEAIVTVAGMRESAPSAGLLAAVPAPAVQVLAPVADPPSEGTTATPRPGSQRPAGDQHTPSPSTPATPGSGETPQPPGTGEPGGGASPQPARTLREAELAVRLAEHAVRDAEHTLKDAERALERAVPADRAAARTAVDRARAQLTTAQRDLVRKQGVAARLAKAEHDAQHPGGNHHGGNGNGGAGNGGGNGQGHGDGKVRPSAEATRTSADDHRSHGPGRSPSTAEHTDRSGHAARAAHADRPDRVRHEGHEGHEAQGGQTTGRDDRHQDGGSNGHGGHGRHGGPGTGSSRGR